MSEVQDFNARIAEEFRANGGRVGMFADTTLLLLTTTGAKTGAARLNPLVYYGEGDRYMVFASAGGSPRHPDWYRNLKANPEVTARGRHRDVSGPGDRAQPATSATASSPPRPPARRSSPSTSRDTTRTIPVIALERI